MPLPVLPQTLTVVTVTETMTDGFPAYSEASTTVRGILYQFSPSEDDASREAGVTGAKAILPLSTVIGRLDRVIVDGKSWAVVGEPYPVQTLGGPNHLQVTLRLLEG